MNPSNLKQKHWLSLVFIFVLLGLVILGFSFLKSYYQPINDTLEEQQPTPSSMEDAVSSSFKFGLNSAFTDKVLKKILSNPSGYSLYSSLFSEYHVEHLRYPGGIPVRYYFWDNEKLSNFAIDKISQYYVLTNGKKTEEYNRLTITPQVGNYEQFLKFSKASGINPIIEMNTYFYHDGNNVYPTALFNGNKEKGVDLGLQPDRWIKIQSNLEAQIAFSHSILPGNITWELGNEDYSFFPAIQYGEIVMKYTDIIKAKYPNDKVIAELSAGNFVTERKGKWNEDFVNYLNQNNYLSKIDYFAPHFYIGTLFTSQVQTDINTRIKSTDFNTWISDIKSNFPLNYALKLSITEFAPLLTVKENLNFNTQLHAMLMWDELMKFHSDSSIASVTLHGFTMDKNALFFDKSIASQLSYVDQSEQDSNVFSYIPPQADAIKTFYNGTGDNFVKFSVNDNYELLVTQTGNTKYLQVLNYNDTIQTIDISQYGEGTFTTYTLPALTTYYWDAEANKTTGNTTSIMTLPAHSFTTVIIK